MTIERLLAPLVAFTVYACSQENEVTVEPIVNLPHKKTVQKIYDRSEWNAFISISECNLKERTLFTSSPIGVQVSKKIVYDNKGEEIGLCNYSSGTVSEICRDLSGRCKEIFVSKGNLAQRVAPARNDYGIGYVRNKFRTTMIITLIILSIL